MAPGNYQQAGAVSTAMSVAQQTMHQSGPQYSQQQQQQPQQQQQNNGNNCQTPPTSQQQQQSSQATNPSSASGPPPPPPNAAPAVIAYPQSAPTPQSPQYATAPGGGAYPVGQQFVVYSTGGASFIPTAAAAQQLYGNQGVAQIPIHNPAIHHLYPSSGQPHFVPADYASVAHMATIAAAQQGNTF